MNDYSDIIYLMGAMVLFSLLTMNVTRNMVINNSSLSDIQIEHEAITLAHSHIDKLQWIRSQQAFTDRLTEDYSTSNSVKESIETDNGKVIFYIYAKYETVNITNSDATNIKVVVGVENWYLNENFNPNDASTFSYPIKLEFIKSFPT